MSRYDSWLEEFYKTNSGEGAEPSADELIKLIYNMLKTIVPDEKPKEEEEIIEEEEIKGEIE